MHLSTPTLRDVFSDKSSLVLRALFREPKRQWTIRQLTKEGVSLGLASTVLRTLEGDGFFGPSYIWSTKLCRVAFPGETFIHLDHSLPL